MNILIYFQAFDEVMKNIQMCSKLEELLLKKKYFIYGDSPQLHAEKVIILISFITEASYLITLWFLQDSLKLT